MTERDISKKLYHNYGHVSESDCNGNKCVVVVITEEYLTGNNIFI